MALSLERGAGVRRQEVETCSGIPSLLLRNEKIHLVVARSLYVTLLTSVIRVLLTVTASPRLRMSWMS